jgi:ATP-dependent helicase/nuclease subunit A
MSDAPRFAAYEHNGKPVSADRFYAIACDPRRSVAVEACAGAGKTWMLVSRIVRALLDGMDPQDGHLRVSPHEILAITFTKRAASEMRERLYQWLAQFAEAPDDVLVTELQARGVYGVDEDRGLSLTSRRLSQLYQRVLESGRQVQVRTFHSWFAALLRAAPLAVLQQLELPLNYELLEDDGPATGLVWRRFYQALVADPLHKADFEAVVLEHGRFQTEKALAVALDKRIEFALADSHGIVDASVEHFHRRFPALAQFRHPHDALENPAARDRWLAWAQSLGQESNKTPQKAAQRVLDAFALPASPALTGEANGTSRLEILRKAFFVADDDRLTQHLKKYPAAQEAERELALLCAASHQHEAWAYQQRMARLTRVLIGHYAALKRERGWVDMPDVERAAQILLSDRVLSGWVQERLDAQVKHLLIDEFQDTNPLQWQALMSWLGAYAGAGGHVPSVFIVGDPKQSIYRFRRAEPQVFVAAQEFVAHGLGGDLLSCDHTRRNATRVIETVNAVMANARAADQYEGFREHTTSSTERGRVCTLPPVPRPEAPVDDGQEISEVWRDSLNTPRDLPEEALRTMEARQVAGWIAHQLSEGVQACDVMVLSRRRAGLLPMQDELRGLRIPAQIGEKTALIDCCEVQDIVALLDVLVTNQHDLSMARALKSPLFGLSDDALITLALARKKQDRCWFELLRQAWAPGDELHGIGDILLRWKNWLDRLPPHDAIQAIYSDGDVLARFAMAAPAVQRDAVLANLRALLAASLQLGGGRYATPYAFVRALKAGGVQAPASVNDAAVRLLTIHGAKGLEAQAVVLLDTDTPERAGETMGVLVDWPAHAAQPRKFVFLAREAHPPACAVPTLEHEKTQRKREELNAMYVALTRARDTLVISSITPHRDATGSWWQRLSSLITERVVPAPLVAGRDISPAGAAANFYLKELPVLPLNQILPAAPDGADDGHPPDEDTPLARVGKAMHRLLEWGNASDLNAAAAAREFGLDAEQGARAARQARQVLAGKGSWVWDETVLVWQGNEVELMYQGEPYRLDRLVRRKDTGHWWVLDFKSTGSPQQQPALVEQMQTYRSAVQQVYLGDTVRAAFLTAGGELIELTPDAG